MINVFNATSIIFTSIICLEIIAKFNIKNDSVFFMILNKQKLFN
jgi:hypothetical protein